MAVEAAPQGPNYRDDLPFGTSPEGGIHVPQRSPGSASRSYAAIKPLRHLIVYPALLGQVKRRWGERQDRGSRG